MRVATVVKVLLASTTAWALASQSQSQSAQTSNNSVTTDSLEEVVVTAIKRGQSIAQIHFECSNPGLFSGETTVRTDVEAVVSGPLAENVLGRLGGFCHERWDGFGKNLYTGNDVDTLHECGGKAALQLTPIDKLELLARLHYYHANDSSGLYYYVGPVNQPYPGASTLPQLMMGDKSRASYIDSVSPEEPTVGVGLGNCLGSMLV
jgi:hypothetical protein